MTRTVLANRRPHVAFTFEHEGIRYHCTASRLPSGTVGELFLTTKAGSAAQANAEAAAILCSLCLQHGVSAQHIRHTVGGVIARALEIADAP
jgi:hypothetical protein